MIEDNYSEVFNRRNDADKLNVSGLNSEIPGELKWIAFMDKLSAKDITKHNNIYEMNYIYCLNVLSLWHHEDKHYEQLRMSQQNSR